MPVRRDSHQGRGVGSGGGEARTVLSEGSQGGITAELEAAPLHESLPETGVEMAQDHLPEGAASVPGGTEGRVAAVGRIHDGPLANRRLSLDAPGRFIPVPDAAPQGQGAGNAPLLPLARRPAFGHAQDGEHTQRVRDGGGEPVHEGKFRPGKDLPGTAPVIQERGDLERGEQPRGEQAAPPGLVEIHRMRCKILIMKYFILGELLDAGGAGEDQDSLLEGGLSHKGQDEQKRFHSPSWFSFQN